jgi:phage shock protein PspC (stress-responsive transcriptional regulator)
MDTQDQTTQPQPDEPRRLYRSSDDRVIAGVCGGIGRYFNIDPVIVRIAAVALILFGGAGVVLYVAGLLLMPAEAGGQPPIGGGEGRNRALVIAGVGLLLLITWPLILGGGIALGIVVLPLAVLVLWGLVIWWLVSGEGPSGSPGDIARRSALGIGVLLLCLLVFVGGAWAAGVGGGTVASAIVIAAGVALAIGALFGRVRWLILPTLSLALGVGFVSAAGIDLDGGVGDRHYQPTSAAQVREHYQLGMGQLTVDLTDANLPAGDTPLSLDLGVGNAEVIVPDDVCVSTRAKLGMGAVQVFDRDNAGVDVDWRDRPGAGREDKRLVLDADVGVGAVQVYHPGERVDFGEHHRFHSDSGEGNIGCSGSGQAAGGDAANG